jgi:hypothetical protein
MRDLHYYQYAFAAPDCRVAEIGPGVDARYAVELICDGPTAALASRIALDRFDPDKLQGRTPEEIRWLGEIAARHNEIICQAAASSTVLPLRLGAVFRSRESLQATLARCRPTVAAFLEEFCRRQEWGVKLYLEKRHLENMTPHAGPPAPHYPAKTGPFLGGKASSASGRWAENGDLSPSAAPGTNYLKQKQAQLTARRELRTAVDQTLQAVEQSLSAKAEHCHRIRTLPSELTGRREEMVFNAAFLLPSSAQETWFETIERVRQDICRKGLLLELTGPWPPYHFCPSLEL